MGLKNSLQKFLLKKTFRKKTEKELLLSTKISKIIGRKVDNIDFYKEAFSLKTPNKVLNAKNYERLEFLGDSVLGSVISSYLYKTYPEENEGFLTQMKSKIVNRKNLNLLGEKLKLTDFIQNGSHGSLGENINGNLFEAFVGAIYLDFNYDICQEIILDRLFSEKEIERLEHKIVSYKGLLLEWSQKKKVSIRYETSEEPLPNKNFIFKTCVYLNENKIASATESSKKKAEEKAAQRAFYSLNKKENIIEQKNIT
ncbi:ribonuclease 3 [Cloacibacterium rupense]|uniref:Ribonuclease 3 n=1 Tax=Cloacibacterium rupense TaxID=517423 RepID=A0ABQ2NKE4_9FLAO|nr:ribonuclease III [Cloacibacterium rupense]GGP05562.1 ribonuclease 3 [Cloacibacterium rupense]